MSDQRMITLSLYGRTDGLKTLTLEAVDDVTERDWEIGDLLTLRVVGTERSVWKGVRVL